MKAETNPATDCSPLMEIRDEALDVDEIMQRIQRAIAEKKATRVYVEESWMRQDAEPPIANQHAPVTVDDLALLQLAGRLDLEGAPISSHRPLVGSLIKLVKRCSRFWTRKYTDAIFCKQSHFNLEAAQALGRMHDQLQRLRESQQQLEQELDALKESAKAETMAASKENE